MAPDTGTVTLAADGGFQYTAPDGYSGQVGFTYSASAEGVSELARVTLDVRSTANVPPQAIGEQFGVLEDHLLDSSASGSLLANDSDYEGAALTLLVEPAGTGVLTAQSNGHSPIAPAHFNGTTASATRQRWRAPVQPAVATINVFAQNDAPQAQQTYTLDRTTRLWWSTQPATVVQRQ